MRQKENPAVTRRILGGQFAAVGNAALIRIIHPLVKSRKCTRAVLGGAL